MAKKKKPDAPTIEGLDSDQVERLADVSDHFKKLEGQAAKITSQDVDDLITRGEEIHKKTKEVPGTLKRFANQIGLLFEMVKDYSNGSYKEIPFLSIAMVVVALVYFLSPIDLIPDFIPVIGYVDDAMIVALTVRAIQEDLRDYCAWKGYDPSKYF